MENTDRLNLPYLMAAQAQKHVTHNEALRMLDSIIHMRALSRNVTDPPAEPTAGDCYLLGDTPTGAWQNQSGNLAVFVDDFWLFHTPKPGWRLWLDDEAILLVFDAGQWKSLLDGLSFDNLPGVGVGTTSDETNKLAVSGDAALFTHTGTGHQIKINKNSIADTASILFQTNWNGRAEFGTTGDDNWHVKTTADGISWKEALIADAGSGAVSFPNGTDPSLLVDAVNDTGGDSFVLGPPNLKTVANSRASINLTTNRLYFSAFYVDRPTQLLGGSIALYTASTTAGAIVRAGIYELGAPNNNNWNPGPLIADFGTRPADAAGHKSFELAAPILLQPGWYLSTMGCNGAGAKVRYVRWMVPGLVQYYEFGTGTNADFRVAGPSIYLYSNGEGDKIANGLPSVWSSGAIADVQSAVSYVYQLMVPKWVRW